MVRPKFTPRPWKLETESRSADGSDLLVTTSDGAWNIADCRDHSGLGIDSVEQAEANARLIAAAPSLYWALDEAVRVLDKISSAQMPRGRMWEIVGEVLRVSHDALAKAEGLDGAP